MLSNKLVNWEEKKKKDGENQELHLFIESGKSKPAGYIKYKLAINS